MKTRLPTALKSATTIMVVFVLQLLVIVALGLSHNFGLPTPAAVATTCIASWIGHAVIIAYHSSPDHEEPPRRNSDRSARNIQPAPSVSRQRAAKR